MNIVWLTPEVPYPPIGGRNGVFNRIVQLSKQNNIYLFSIAYNAKEKSEVFEMEKYCKEVHFFDRSEFMLWTLIKSIFMPYSVASRFRKDIMNGIIQLAKNGFVDVVIVDFPNMAKNILPVKKKYPQIPMTINQHNIEFARMRDMVKIQTIPIYKRISYFLESFRLEVYERKLYRSRIFESISFFSDDDHRFFNNNIETGNTILKTIPLGANDYGKVPLGLNNRTLLFVGRLDKVAIPNVEGILWFVNKVLPLVIDEIPDVRLIIAGANPTEEIKKLENSTISVIPNFSSMDAVYNMADIVILPLLSGGGVKGKLLEAIAYRKHIVTTSHGIEGTLFKKEVHVSLADSECIFAEECIKVLCEPSSFRERENRAYDLFKNEYDWHSIGRKYQDFVKAIQAENS